VDSAIKVLSGSSATARSYIGIGCRAVTEITKVGVVGCGLMGHGIAQICAQAGWDVVVREADQDKLDKGIAKIEKQLARAVEKGKLEQADADAARGRITPTLDYAELAGSELVIEAMTEDLDAKLEMWREVDGVAGDAATFATNTSSLPVVDQAMATSRPERFLGMHFFNPAQVMPLLEVVQTVTTSDEALKLGFDVGEKLGKTTVHAKDKTGFIVNRLLVPYMLDAIRAYEEGFGSIEEIDTAMKAGANHPMGPLTLLDFVGLDTTNSIAEVMFEEFRERRFAPPPTLRKMVAAGMYGRKSGQGFYDYSGEKPVPSELGL
jgi:3-hydroxybutyryl-CoA dehydrogenase